MTLRRGDGYTYSSKKNMNMRISTEAELVIVDDNMLQVIWAQNFIQAQGYEVMDNIIYQYNQSSMKPEKNGRA